jgi:hypothetical protein
MLCPITREKNCGIGCQWSEISSHMLIKMSLGYLRCPYKLGSP